MIAQLLETLNTYDSIWDVWELIKKDWRHSFYEDLTLYELIWEHPTVTENNKKSDILNNWFCSIYQYENRFVFVIGRLGNTQNYVMEVI